MDPIEALENIIYARVHTSEIQDNLITLAAAQMIEERFALIIVDSIINLFRVDYQGRGQLADR
jgi:RecA/RadA recombinase